MSLSKNIPVLQPAIHSITDEKYIVEGGKSGPGLTDAILGIPELGRASIGVEEETLSAESISEEPGLKGWINVLGAFLIGFVCYGATNSYGIFQAYYQTHQLSSLPASTISWIGSIQVWLVLLLGSVSGPLFDAGYLKSLLIIGTSTYVICFMFTSISTEFYQFLLSQGIGVGLGMGIMFSPALSCMGQHFSRSKYRTIAYGIFSVGNSLGGVVFPIMLRFLFESIGFGWSVRVMAFMVAACGFLGYLCLSRKHPPKKDILILSFTVFRHRGYTLLVAGACFFAAGALGPMSFGVTYAQAHGMTQSLAFYSLSILNAVSMVGRFLPAVVAKYTGPINMLIMACISTGIMVFCWTKAESVSEILAYNALYGFCSGGYNSSFPPSIASLDIDPGRTGLYLGMAFFTTSFFWLSAGPITAALIGVGLPQGFPSSDERAYLGPSIYGGFAVMVGVGFMIVSRRLRTRLTGGWRA